MYVNATLCESTTMLCRRKNAILMHVTLTHASNQESSKAPDATLNTIHAQRTRLEKKSHFPSTWPDKKATKIPRFFFIFSSSSSHLNLNLNLNLKSHSQRPRRHRVPGAYSRPSCHRRLSAWPGPRDHAPRLRSSRPGSLQWHQPSWRRRP
jgi:hypothetical protein